MDTKTSGDSCFNSAIPGLPLGTPQWYILFEDGVALGVGQAPQGLVIVKHMHLHPCLGRTVSMVTVSPLFYLGLTVR